MKKVDTVVIVFSGIGCICGLALLLMGLCKHPDSTTFGMITGAIMFFCNMGVIFIRLNP